MPTRIPQRQPAIPAQSGPPWLRQERPLALVALMGCCAIGGGVLSAQAQPPSSSRSSVTYGTVKQLPHNRNGLWFIGRETIESDAFTDLQENYGPLAIGACVAVEKRGNRARRIMTVRSTACMGPAAPERVLR